jgi:hypothetical protein
MADWSIYKDVSLEELGLSTRALNALKRNGMTTIGDVASLKVRDLLDIRNLGVASIRNVLQRTEEFLDEPSVSWPGRVQQLEQEVDRIRSAIARDPAIWWAYTYAGELQQAESVKEGNGE